MATPLSSAWTLYAHRPATAGDYTSAYSVVAEARTCEEWGALARHARGAEALVLPGKRLTVAGAPVVALSFFRDGVTPEWEHPRNARGHTLSARLCLAPDDARALWVALLCECARGAWDEHVLGVQATGKTTRGAPHLKVDVWCASGTPTLRMARELRHWGREWGLAPTDTPRR